MNTRDLLCGLHAALSVYWICRLSVSAATQEAWSALFYTAMLTLTLGALVSDARGWKR